MLDRLLNQSLDVSVPRGGVRDCECTLSTDRPLISRKECRRLLAAILAQAMQDEMSVVRFRMTADGSALSMQYYGPADADEPAWWDMVPPPVSVYPQILQAVLESAELRPMMPLSGHIPARRDGRPVRIDFELRDGHELTLTWDQPAEA